MEIRIRHGRSMSLLDMSRTRELIIHTIMNRSPIEVSVLEEVVFDINTTFLIHGNRSVESIPM